MPAVYSVYEYEGSCNVRIELKGHRYDMMNCLVLKVHCVDVIFGHGVPSIFCGTEL